MSNHSSMQQTPAHSLPIRVLDEYYQDIPDDLYIPPEAFAILLEQFEGPLDFLLYLVKKNGFDLKTLDIAPIAQQYLSYMEKMKSSDIELTAEYMLMAATLANLKSHLLLPKLDITLQHEADPRKQLIQRLEEYLQIKSAAERLGQLNILERDVFTAKVSMTEQKTIPQGYDRQSLHDALLCILLRPEPITHHVEYESVSLDERIQTIRQQIASGEILDFQELLQPKQGRLGVVVTFIAVLELAKQQQISIIHDGQNGMLSIQGKSHA